MAEQPKEKEQVRYQLLKPAFVGGVYLDPNDGHAPGVERVGGKSFVMADPGLEGTALKLEKKAPAKPPSDDGKPPTS